VLALVALGCGIGLVPRLVAERAPGSAGLHVVRVDPPLVSFDIGMCTLPTNLERRPVAALWRTLAS
jgi:LysR family positive regulator for ilvC